MNSKRKIHSLLLLEKITKLKMDNLVAKKENLNREINFLSAENGALENKIVNVCKVNYTSFLSHSKELFIHLQKEKMRKNNEKISLKKRDVEQILKEMKELFMMSKKYEKLSDLEKQAIRVKELHEENAFLDELSVMKGVGVKGS